MALKKSIAFKGLSAPDCYIVVKMVTLQPVTVEGGKQYSVDLRVEYYTDSTKENSLQILDYSKTFAPNDLTFPKFYQHLKTLNEFAEAIDC